MGEVKQRQGSVFLVEQRDIRLVQSNQLDKSACGATAIFNGLKVLTMNNSTCEKLKDLVEDIKKDVRLLLAVVPTRGRTEENACVSDYLQARATAGCTAPELVDAINSIAKNCVCCRFFSFTDIDRNFPLVQWLAWWMKHGAVPIATLNRQKLGSFYDCWHHQMIYGVDMEQKEIHVTNIITRYSEEKLLEMLASEPVLLIKPHDLLPFFRSSTKSFAELPGLKALHQLEDWKLLDVTLQLQRLYDLFQNDQVDQGELIIKERIRVPCGNGGIILLVCNANEDICSKLMAETLLRPSL